MEYKIFWCKVNKYYTEKWLNDDYMKNKKWIFIASCVVTDKAKKKWVKYVIDTVKKINFWEKIFISWCWAFERGKELKSFFEIYPELEKYQNQIEILWEDPDENKLWKDTKNNLAEEPNLSENKIIDTKKIASLNFLTTKKFLLIQGWCDSFCTFCLTVQKRWRHFFRSSEEIINEIIEYEENWWKEIVLTWVNLWAWWLKTTNDIWKSKLHILLNKILKNTKIQRIRISSLWPEFVDDKLLKIFEHERIYPHFHFSIQSASNNILKSMSRHYDAKYMQELLDKVRKIKRKDWVWISIWADIIVWFPGETEKDFLDTFDLIQDFQITKVHAFQFSQHKYWESVPAWSFQNQIDEKTKKERLWIIMKLWENVRDKFIESQIWESFKVLLESVKNWQFKWWTQNYIEVTNDNFEIISWIMKRNEIVIWKLIK